jgi:hypothetical protein
MTALQVLQANNELYELEANRQERKEKQDLARRQKEAAQSMRDQLLAINTPESRAAAAQIGMGGDITGPMWESIFGEESAPVVSPENLDPDLATQVESGQMKPKDAITIQDQRRRHLEGQESGLRDDFMKEISPDRQVLESWDAMKDITPAQIAGEDGGKIDGELIKRYSKMILPREAVMSDDVRIVMDQNRSVLESYLKRLANGESLDKTERLEILRRMQELANVALERYQKTAGSYSEQSALYPGMDSRRVISWSPNEFYEHPALVQAQKEEEYKAAKERMRQRTRARQEQTAAPPMPVPNIDPMRLM